MSKFSEQVHISISSFEKNIIYYDLKLSQQMADHHYFSFVWQYTGKAVIEPEDQEKAISKYNGSEVIFTFKVNGIKLMCKGIINGLESIDLHGSPAGLHVYGISHTVLLDDLKKSRIFMNKNLQQIALEIFAETSSGEFYQRDAIVPTHTKVFSNKAQYNETSFNFMKRLSARYGQWYYFDGMRMQFGQTKASKVKLINGSSLHQFRIKTKLASHLASLGSYDYNTAKSIKNSAEKSSSANRDRFSVSAVFNQGSITRRDLSIGAYTNNANNKEEIDEMIRLETASRDANSVFYGGISYYPIGVGQVFTIQNKTVEHELIAIEVHHYSEVNGNYSCEFKAIPAEVAVPHYTDAGIFASADSQPARVVDNNDPEKMGRIKVEYYWGHRYNESDWMRMIQPHSGRGKGFYFIPEIGEEVLVGFEGGNFECPYVMGTHYNGAATSGYETPQNDLKVIQTRSGNRIISNDETGDVTIESQKGQTIAVIHGDGNIKFKAPKNIEFEAGEDFIVNAGRNISTSAGQNISESALTNKSTNVGGILHTNVGGDNLLKVFGDCHEDIEGNLNSDIKKDKNYIVAGKSIVQSENGHEFHSDKTIKNNSSEDTRQN
ncbi:type VI secretion system Vgr family protein [Flavobacterium ustbae]|uniref:type VI secretion system Vgr family protein n=1 Tax=Flavobacterium ustbae TaxID=2488790 RepID=UPI000F7B3276|nr:phage baseplate assembly protein V [Flavobacterium ustbae]